jgi:hypothetical protein
MLSPQRSFALASVALVASVSAACSSSSDSPYATATTAPPATTTATARAPAMTTVDSPPATTTTTTTQPTPATGQGPLSGTYSADSLEGTAPFIAITFTDASHYSYVAKSCFAAPVAPLDGADGDDSGDPVADHGATPDYEADPTDNGCIHTGTYLLTATTLTVTDDGDTSGVTLPVAELALDGTEVQDPSAMRTSNADAGASSSALLFGLASVSAITISGAPLRRTGLVNVAGVGSLCTIGNGTQGICLLTSTCAAAEQVATPDFCPGPDDVQCCTTKETTPDAGAPSGGETSAVSRAQQWVTVKMPYCEAANGARDYDSSCSSVCHRTGAANESQWNAYRSDCSGLVSWSWGLAAPGLVTETFVPGAASFIPTEDLQPGDAILRPSEHVVLFDHWMNKATGTADVISEPGCSAGVPPYAQHQTWSLGRAPGSASPSNWGGATYYATRKRS